MNDEARELALTIANRGAFTDEDAVVVAQAYLETLPLAKVACTWPITECTCGECGP